MADSIRRQHRFTVTPEHLILDPRVSDRAFRLWCRLDRFAGESESAYPLRETLCIELDCSPASIDRATKDLVEAGWLLKERRAEGDRNLYTLIVAPEREVEKLVKAARKAREEATQPRRDKRREQRREQKRGSSVKGSAGEANTEVSKGGVVTGDATPNQGGVITDDATPVITDDARGVITGDAQKEATGKEATGQGETSLSQAADAASDEGAESDSNAALYRDDVTRVCEHLLARIKENGYKPVPNITQEWRRSARLLMDKDGRTERQVHNMIEWATNDDFWRPNIRSMLKLRKHYDQMKERAAQETQRQGLRRGYDDVATWGKPEDDKAEVMSDAEAAALFAQPRTDRPQPRTGTNG